MNVLISLVAVIGLILLVIFGVSGMHLNYLFGIIIPGIAIAAFIIGLVYRVIKWAKAPVPFRITTTCGQQKSLSWIPSNNFENPHNTLGVIGRMLLEILFFRSLFRNTKMELKEGPRLVYGSSKYLWLGAMAFHWSFLVVLIRHFRFFTEPVPFFVYWLQGLDGFLQLGVPVFYATNFVILAALSYLFLRRLFDPKLRYISLPADYFALFLLLGIAGTGVLMRYIFKVDLIGVKQMTLGLLSFNPVVPEGIGVMFFIHLFLVSALLAYFPFSKLMHMAGVFMSPTRNLANTNRSLRHINPWNYPVNFHTYEEWEDEFRDKMKAAGLPLERE